MVDNKENEFYQRYILLHPLKYFSLILQPNVQVSVCYYFLACEKAPRSNSVVEGYNDDIQIGCHDQAGTIQIGVGISIETTSLYEDKYRMQRAGICRGIDVEKKTILRSGS